MNPPTDLMDDLLKMYKEEYSRMVKRVSYRVGGITNAEDVVQEAFASAMKYSATYNNHKPLDKWFNTILNNEARDFKRQERLDGMSTEEEGTDTLETTVYREELLGRIAEEIEKKPEGVREILVGSILKGWKPREIAKYSTYTPVNIRKIIQRFKDEMKRRYGEDMCS